MNNYILFIFATCIAQVVCQIGTGGLLDKSVLKLTAGSIRGRLITSSKPPTIAGGYVYLGLPYAQAPNGTYRFRPPRPLPNDTLMWTGVRDATEYRDACIQNLPIGHRELFGNQSEDCLTVRPDQS
jgi:hypothetical protein